MVLNPAEICAMRKELLREEEENKKKQKLTEGMNKCKQNIAKYNLERQLEAERINESINSMSSVQRGKEYNENLRKQMKLKAEKKKKGNQINDIEKKRGRTKEENIDYKERYEILKKYQAFLKNPKEIKK